MPFFLGLLTKNVNDKAIEVFEAKEFIFVNDCFKNENNALLGIFLQKVIDFFKYSSKSRVLFVTFVANNI